jgi:cytochrome c
MNPRTLMLLTCAGLLSLAPAIHGQNFDPNKKPDDNRFSVVRLTQPNELNEPMVFEVLPDGRAYIIERRGAIKYLDPATQTVKPVGALAVNNRVRQGNGEQGLVGMTLDPKFTENGWMYLYYQHPVEEKSVLSRWEIRDNVLVANSEKVLLEWPAQRETCCHTGGGMTWDSAGNLFITVGNNRGNNLTAHTDERPGRAPWDDQGGSANSNALEGKILRIHPEPDGTYTIPKANLFPPGTPKTRPEIYTMGHRNAWRVSLDSKTGFIYWGEVGPDVRRETESTPVSYDEFNQARGPGYFGWPYFVGDSAYPHFDYAANKAGEKKDPTKPINNSPNNTGLTELPPMAPAFIYYPYGVSEKFPVLGSGARSATGGPIYHRADFKEPKRPWPAYFEDKWIATEFSRRMVLAISMKEIGDYQGMERLLPNYKPVEPIDAKFGPEGDLYVLEYGGRWFQPSPDAKLTRIEFEAGNRKPIAIAAADKAGGIPPFDVKLSSAGTQDYDGDKLTYQWDVIDQGGNSRTFKEANPVAKLAAVGTYLARLTVTDPTGASDSKTVKIVSGNEPPTVALKLAGNETFYFTNNPFGYAVEVIDREDGSLKDGRIKPEQVDLSIDYVSAEFDLQSLLTLAPGDGVEAKFPVAQALIAKGNCKSCHLPDAKLVGPSFLQIAEKYRGNAEAPAQLAQKIVTGGAGVWSPTHSSTKRTRPTF